MRRTAAALAAAALCGVVATPAAACRLALVLALDVSSSVDAAEDRLQREGLAAALRDPDVQSAFFAAEDPVALNVFEWSGRRDQVALLPDWVLIRSPADIDAAAAAILRSTRSRTDMPTALGHALGHAATLLRRGPDCASRTVDVAGDGENNEGFGPADAYAAFGFDLEEVTVNALVVQGPNDSEGTDLVRYFREGVIRGPGAFVELADGYGDYARAMRRKLLAELAVRAVSAIPAPEGVAG